MTEAEFLRLLSNLSKSIEVLNRKSDAMNSPIERFQMTLRDLNPGVRGEHALAQIVEDHDAHDAAEPAKRLLMQLGPAPGARLEEQQPDALAAVAEGEDEEPRAAVLARDGMPDHRAGAVVDLRFLTRRRHDHRVGVRGPLPLPLDDEAANAGVPRGNPWSSTRSRQIAMASRPRVKPTSISSR